MKDLRREKLENELASLEAEYRENLVVALHGCIDGYGGLFGQNDHLELPGNLRQRLEKNSGATALFSLAKMIEAIRDRLGLFEPFALHARFLSERGRQNENRLGEGKLAQLWLDELEAQNR